MKEHSGPISRTRIAIAVPGIALIAFGIFRLVTQIDGSDLLMLFLWLLGALIIHDGLLSMVIVGLGALLHRTVPPRARTYVQAFLIAGALITIVALPMIYRRDSQPKVKAILQQNFGANLATLLAFVAVGAVLLYALRLLRDRRVTSSANQRPPDDHEAATS